MSSEKNHSEARRWLETAVDDLEAADILCRQGKHALACFHAQQAGEKALKAILYAKGLDPWGHSLLKLLNELMEHDPLLEEQIKPMLDNAARLDQFYIPTRYPNGVPDILPRQAYRRPDAEEGLKCAERMLEFARTIAQDVHGTPPD